MLRRLGVAVGGVFLLSVAALASMVRIVPADAPATAAAGTHGQVAAAPTRGGWSHPVLTVPVQGVQRSQIADSWGQSRANGARAHQATDIMAPGGTPVVAAAPGTVEKLFNSQGGGGITLYVRSPDRQWLYYYAHLQGYAAGVTEGLRVNAGDLLGYVGDTGNSGVGNYHLHFALSHMAPGDRWHQGTPVNPYPLLAGSAARR